MRTQIVVADFLASPIMALWVHACTWWCDDRNMPVRVETLITTYGQEIISFDSEFSARKFVLVWFTKKQKAREAVSLSEQPGFAAAEA
jgi:hypothetical protein